MQVRSLKAARVVRSEKTYPLRNTFGNDGNGPDLRELHELHGRLVNRPRRGKVDHGINIGVLGDGLLHRLVDGKQSLARTPVHLAHELSSECVDDAGNRGGFALADEVEVEHALYGTGLKATVGKKKNWLAMLFLLFSKAQTKIPKRYLLDEASCLGVEEGVCSWRAQRSAGSLEAADVVVGREVGVRGESVALDRRGVEAIGVRRRSGSWNSHCGFVYRCVEVIRRIGGGLEGKEGSKVRKGGEKTAATAKSRSGGGGKE